MEFNNKLQKLRKENAMSQEELAGQLNVSRQAVSKWENGQGFPETDKLLQLSNLFNVSVDYLLKDETPVTEDGQETDNSYYASREMVQSFLASRKQNARQIAAGVAVIILSFIFPTIFEHSAGERMEMMGALLMLLFIFAGAVILIMVGFRPKRYASEITERPLVFDAAFIRDFRAQYQTVVRKRAGMKIVAGIGTILLGILLMMVLDTFRGGNLPMDAILFPFIAGGVALIISGGSTISSYGFIAENEKYRKEEEESKRTGWVMGTVMLLAVAAFLFMGLAFTMWRTAWIVFPVAALVGVAIQTFVNRGK